MGNNCFSTVLSLGTNLGDREQNLILAKNLLSKYEIRIEAESEILETNPIGFEAENKFLNQLVIIRHLFSPIVLLEEMERIERKMGRKKKIGSRGGAYQSRIIDIDIVLFDNLVFSNPRLTIPHPALNERFFLQSLLKQLKTKSILLKSLH